MAELTPVPLPVPLPALLPVLLVDDHAVVRTGCRQLLEDGGAFRVVEASSGEEALRLAGAENPVLVVLDLNLPDLNGFEVIRRLRDSVPQAHILVFSMHEDPAHVARALEAGARGYVTKSDDPDTIVEAAQKVAQGDRYLSQPVAQLLALHRLHGADDGLSVLTRREREVLRLFGQGKTLSEIAAALGISYKTTANTCSQIKTKLNLSSTSELMRVAVEQRGRGEF